jgi:hypothetical protein
MFSTCAFSTCSSKITSAISIFSVVACLSCLMFSASGWGQQASPQAPAAVGDQTPKPEVDKTEKAKDMGTRPEQPPPVIQQLNSALERLTARISPAVVQVLVTGYGALDENSRGQTAVIAR